MTHSKISIIVPTYNEENNIIPLINALHDELKVFDHEIIVVDDQSQDRTYKCVSDLNDSRVRSLLRQSERSLGGSIRDGIEKSCGDIIVVMDSDFNHQPKYLSQMIQKLMKYDCVFASRFLKGGGMEGPARYWLSYLFNGFIRLMIGGTITDSLYGFFVIKRKIIKQMKYDNIFWGYGDYCIRLVYYLQKQKINIGQIPAMNGERLSGSPNRRFGKVFIKYVWAVLELSLKRDDKSPKMNLESST